MITIQLRSLPLFQFKTLNGFLLSAGLQGRGAFCQIVSFGLADCLVSVIRCLAGVLSGNDELAFCEKHFIAITESTFSCEVGKENPVYFANFIHPVFSVLNACPFKAFSSAPIVLSVELILCNELSDF